MTSRHYVFFRQRSGRFSEDSMHLYCDVMSLCKFGASKSYHISGIFRVGLIFAEFATSLKSPKLDTAKINTTIRLH